MSMSAWRLKGSLAELEIAGLCGTLDTADPMAGLVFDYAGRAKTGGASPDSLCLFAMELPAQQSAQQQSVSPDCQVRGNDLVAIYRESPPWPVHLDAVWRVAFPPDDKRVLAALDVVLSIHTSLLDSHPQLTATTTVPKSCALRLTDGGAARWQSLDVAPGGEHVLEPSTGCGCVVVRLPGTPWSYVEMVHPADFRSDRWTACGSNSLQLRHSLFPQTLEKGVLIRARMRGVWVTRDGDLETAAACYVAFATDDPPLATYGAA